MFKMADFSTLTFVDLLRLAFLRHQFHLRMFADRMVLFQRIRNLVASQNEYQLPDRKRFAEFPHRYNVRVLVLVRVLFRADFFHRHFYARHRLPSFVCPSLYRDYLQDRCLVGHRRLN